jgi:hypothetical protein
MAASPGEPSRGGESGGPEASRAAAGPGTKDCGDGPLPTISGYGTATGRLSGRPFSFLKLASFGLKSGGGGIRTHGTLARPTVFKTAPFDRSGTPPTASSSANEASRTTPRIEPLIRFVQMARAIGSNLSTASAAPGGIMCCSPERSPCNPFAAALATQNGSQRSVCKGFALGSCA